MESSKSLDEALQRFEETHQLKRRPSRSWHEPEEREWTKAEWRDYHDEMRWRAERENQVKD